MVRPSVLCPVDFSDASRGALRYGAAIAAHFGARLTVATVNDPLLASATAGAMGADWLESDCRRELDQFIKHATDDIHPTGLEVLIEVTVGKPAPEILRLARERSVDVIVMSSHGLTGTRKLFFGSTTERVLRETSVPVLVTPQHDRGPAGLTDVKQAVRRILAPIDLTEATSRQVQVARGLAEALDVPMVLAHVVEPVRVRLPAGIPLPSLEIEMRDRAERVMQELASTIPPQIRLETLIAYGDPAEEIAKIAHDRHAGLIVMGLHSSPLAGRRMGSVTYRVLCLSPTLMLAWPPGEAQKSVQARESAVEVRV